MFAHSNQRSLKILKAAVIISLSQIEGSDYMDVDEKTQIIRSFAEEIITEEELKQVFETKTHPVTYDGFEPSGLAHLPFGVYRPLLIKDMQKTGIKFKLWLADWFSWINNKMGGDLEKIHKVGEYFIEVWKAAGVKNVDYIWASESMDKEYWKKVIMVAKNTTVQRATRCLTIMGRKENEMKEVAQYFYPMMQTTDIFQLECDITQLGLDQRRACILAREVGPKIGLWKPVVVSHHMLMSLAGAKEPEGYEANKKIDMEISSKMSKSKPATSIFVHDSSAEIKDKISRAYCPEKIIENNPIMDYAKHLIFKSFEEIKIERPKKFGGDVIFDDFGKLEKMYSEGKLHPADLKNAVALDIDKLVAPIRKHFETVQKARELYHFVKNCEVTR